MPIKATDYLRDLATRLRKVPVCHGVDGYDIDTLRDVSQGIASQDAEIARLREALVAAEGVMAKNIYPKPDVGPEHPWSVLQSVRAALKEKADA